MKRPNFVVKHPEVATVIGVAYARLIRLKPTYIFKSYSSLGLSLPIFFKSYCSVGLTLKPTFNHGFDLLDKGLALIIQ